MFTLIRTFPPELFALLCRLSFFLFLSSLSLYFLSLFPLLFYHFTFCLAMATIELSSCSTHCRTKNKETITLKTNKVKENSCTIDFQLVVIFCIDTKLERLWRCKSVETRDRERGMKGWRETKWKGLTYCINSQNPAQSNRNGCPIAVEMCFIWK